MEGGAQGCSYCGGLGHTIGEFCSFYVVLLEEIKRYTFDIARSIYNYFV